MQEEDLYNKYLLGVGGKIIQARAESAKLVADIRNGMQGTASGICVVVTGSVARGEITSQSDFDSYAICEGSAKKKAAQQELNSVQRLIALRDSSIGGAFGGVHLKSELVKNIGGNKETNDSFTRRILFILESKNITGEKEYSKILKNIVDNYIREDITHHQLGRYLLNDIIRFYRTMCVDFEHKTNNMNKPWGVRNIKLVFSRKLIYFSGVVMCAELAEMRMEEKRRRLMELASMTPIERLLEVMGVSVVPAMEEYNYFLSSMDKTEVRKTLESVSSHSNKDIDIYRDLKSSGHRFNWKLSNALSATYPQSHPIHDAILL